jgi:hypothetical protein
LVGLNKEMFSVEYWIKLWGWYRKGGKRHVTTYLDELDISDFDAKAPPPKTAAFWAIVDTGRAPEEAEMADVLEKMGNPSAVTLAGLSQNADGGSFYDWLTDRKNRRVIPHRLGACGYTQVQNDTAKDHYFVVGGRRQVIYAKSDLTAEKRMMAAQELVSGSVGEEDESDGMWSRKGW